MSERTGNGRHPEVEHLFADLQAAVRDGEDLLKASLATVKERTRLGVARANQYFRERPYQGLAIAFGIGLALGVLTSSWFTREKPSAPD